MNKLIFELKKKNLKKKNVQNIRVNEKKSMMFKSFRGSTIEITVWMKL